MSEHLGTTEGDDRDGGAEESVRAELRNIVNSRHFRASKRSQQFLRYVVDQKLSGNEESLKERVIGVEVFGRDPNYATGDDPVVRVQASDVRRRLDAYRMEAQSEGIVSIELPSGSYIPVFRKRTVSGYIDPDVAAEEPPLGLNSIAAHGQGDTALTPAGFRWWLVPSPSLFATFAWSIALLVIGVAVGYIAHGPPQQAGVIQDFWGPLLSSDKTVVIDLGKPAVYVPSRHLYDLYEASHPGEFDLLYDRRNNFLPLDKRTPITFGDMTPVQFSGPAVEGVRAALTMTLFLGRAGKRSSARFGDEGAFVNLVGLPSIIVGNVNNRWTSDLENNLPLRFHQTRSGEDIIEAGTNRSWGIEDFGEVVRDYGLITREPVGVTGQFLLKIAGIRGGGTEAAAEFVTNAEMLQTAIKRLPKGWTEKNVQILVMAQVIGRKASPPEVIAVHEW